MRILAIGDIVGERAAKKIEEELPKIRKEEKIDFVIANAENAYKGNGLSKELYNQIINSGVDVITMGNHTWGNEEIYDILKEDNIIRPANITKGIQGKGYTICKHGQTKIAVINLIGRQYMQGVYYPNNPFTEIQDILEKIDKNVKIKIIDFHAQGTGEKFVLAYFLDGKVSAVYGTHTHVQTADDQILAKGTGFITDIGMTGAIQSDLGCNPEDGIKRNLMDLKIPDRMSENPIQISGCIFEIDDETGLTIKTKRINKR